MINKLNNVVWCSVELFVAVTSLVGTLTPSCFANPVLDLVLGPEEDFEP